MNKHLPLSLAAIVVAMCWPGAASAHLPRMVLGDQVRIGQPAMSQVFYDELWGAPRVYVFYADKQLESSIRLLVPASSNPDGRYSAAVFRVEDGRRLPVGRIDGSATKWTDYYEEYGNDWYSRSEPFSFRVKEGAYEVEVSGMNDLGRYALAIGKEEAFSFSDAWSAAWLAPQLKIMFFDESPGSLVFSAYGPYACAASVALGVAFWWALYRLIKKIVPQRLRHHLESNLNRLGRLVRLTVGMLLLVLAASVWSLFAFVLACLFLAEAAVGWCVFPTVFGRGQKQTSGSSQKATTHVEEKRVESTRKTL